MRRRYKSIYAERGDVGFEYDYPNLVTVVNGIAMKNNVTKESILKLIDSYEPSDLLVALMRKGISRHDAHFIYEIVREK